MDLDLDGLADKMVDASGIGQGYLPTQRMRILQLRAARGWTGEKTAAVFLIDELTLRQWMRRVDEGGERAIVQTRSKVERVSRSAS